MTHSQSTDDLVKRLILPVRCPRCDHVCTDPVQREAADTIERLQRDLRECVELLELAVFLPSDRRNHDVDPPDCPECKRDALLARIKEKP